MPCISSSQGKQTSSGQWLLLVEYSTSHDARLPGFPHLELIIIYTLCAPIETRTCFFFEWEVYKRRPRSRASHHRRPKTETADPSTSVNLTEGAHPLALDRCFVVGVLLLSPKIASLSAVCIQWILFLTSSTSLPQSSFVVVTSCWERRINMPNRTPQVKYTKVE